MSRSSVRSGTQVFIILAVILMLFGCSRQELYIHGQSSVHSTDLLKHVNVGETTEESLVDILGKPTAYYLKSEDEKYFFYGSISTVVKSRHLPIAPKHVWSTSHESYQARVWFRFANGVVAAIIDEEVAGIPDLNGYLPSLTAQYRAPVCPF